jgi:hypothetical protein
VGVPLPSFARLGGRTGDKAAGNGRRRDPEPARQGADEAADDQELSSYLAALAPETPPESTGSGRRFGDAQVYQLRLNLIASQELKDLATERGTSPQALAQEWVLERLAQESEPSAAQPPPAPRPRHRHQAPTADPPTDEMYLHGQPWEQPVRGRLV